MQRLRLHYPERPLNSSRLSLWGLGIHEQMRRTTVNRPSGIGCHLFLYFYDPVMNLVRKRWVRFPAGSFVVFQPHRAHNFGLLEQCWDHTWLLVGGQLVSRFLRENSVPMNRPIPSTLAPLMEKTVFEIYEEINSNASPCEKLVRNLIQNFCIAAGRHLARREKAAIPEALQKARAYINAHYTSDLSLAGLAKNANLSIPRFAVRYKQTFGVSPIEYLIRLRMERACFLLQDANLNIGQVAREVGYGNLHYFSRLFRKRFGQSPKRFRALARSSPAAVVKKSGRV